MSTEEHSCTSFPHFVMVGHFGNSDFFRHSTHLIHINARRHAINLNQVLMLHHYADNVSSMTITITQGRASSLLKISTVNDTSCESQLLSCCKYNDASFVSNNSQKRTGGAFFCQKQLNSCQLPLLLELCLLTSPQAVP